MNQVLLNNLNVSLFRGEDASFNSVTTTSAATFLPNTDINAVVSLSLM